MSTTPFKSMGLPKSSDKDLDSYVRERGMPVIEKAAPVPKVVEAMETRRTTSNRRVAVELPDYLVRELARAAAERDCTRRFLILEALQKAGWKVEDEDFVEDGRRR